ARTGTPEDGVKGLSLFLCPSDTATGRNTVSVTRIEEKMGIHASPTCQLAFDAAEGDLIGKEGGGLMAMFTMMNHARLDVALQGVAHAARAADIAATYAAERIQGRNASGPVSIDQHPAVQAMLDEQQALAKGGRVMCHSAMVAMETGNRLLTEFLTPVCKAFCTDAGIRSADLGIQVLGGYGYLKEYRVEQTLRDARICAIYEGTNEIHGLTLATRLLRMDNGAAADAFADYVAPRVSAENLAAWQAHRAKVSAASNPAVLAGDFMRVTGLLAWQAAWAMLDGTTPDNTRLAEYVRQRVDAVLG
ncbi:MAG TPA: acyl-CoA dehydrogenase family protein, partial [Paracoccaceae bacterium]|nr:acyl-CoA dehydrogenase family protein [Paracoccaceae bacterium]